MADRLFCPSCGSENEKVSRFCTSCGAQFPEMAAEMQAAGELEVEEAVAESDTEEADTTTDVEEVVATAEPDLASTIGMEAVVTAAAEFAPEPAGALASESEDDSTVVMDVLADVGSASQVAPEQTIAMEMVSGPGVQEVVQTDPDATIAMESVAAGTTVAEVAAARDPEITSMMQPLQPAAPVHYDAAATAEAKQAQHAAKPKRKRGIVIGIIVVLVVIAAAAIGFFLYQDNQNKERERLLQDLANKTYPVDITIQAEGYYPETSSPIPLRIDGTTYSGETVEQKLLVESSSSDTIELERGTYTVMVPVSPVTQAGGIFQTGQASASFTVSDPEVEQFLAESEESKPDAEQIEALLSAPTEAVVVPKLVLTPLSAVSITDSLIAETYQGLIDYGVPQSEAAQYQSAMVEGHQSAVREQRERRAADRSTFEESLRQLRATENSIANSPTNPDSPGFLSLMDKDQKMAELRPLTRQLVDDLYAYVLDALPESERGSLQASQSEWDAATTQAAEDYLAPYKKNGSTVGQSYAYVKMYVDANLSRAADLINMIE